MTKAELQKALALEAKVFNRIVLEAHKAYDTKCDALYKQYHDSANIMVGDIIEGVPRGHGCTVRMRVERIEPSPIDFHDRGYVYFGTFIKTDGSPTKRQYPLGIEQIAIKTVNGTSIDKIY